MWPAPKIKARGLGDHRLDENVQLPSADQSVVVGRVLAEIEIQVARLFGLDDFARRVPDFGLDAPAADGANDGAILADQHFRAFEARDGAVHLDDGGERTFLSQLAQADQFLVDVHPIRLYRVVVAH